jgi:hypothetical protein
MTQNLKGMDESAGLKDGGKSAAHVPRQNEAFSSKNQKKAKKVAGGP